jgi:hypothetical protein
VLEPLLFVEEVEGYFALKSPSNRYQKARLITDKFFTTTSKHDLNLSQKTRSSVLQVFNECNENNCPKDLFDECLSIIMLEIKEDIWPRFSKSNQMKEYSKQFNTADLMSDESTESEKEIHQIFSKNNKFITDQEYEVSKHWCIQDNIDGVKWKVTKRGKDCTAYISGRAIRMDTNSNRYVKMWKLEGILNFSVETVLAVQTSVEMLLKSDPNQVESYQMEYLVSPDLTKASTILYDRVEFPLMIASRDMTSAVSIKLEQTDEGFKRYILLRKAVHTQNTPKKKGVIHADMILCKVFEQTNTQDTVTRIYEVGWLDLKGSVPLLIWNKMVAMRGTKLHSSIIKGCIMYLEENKNCTSDKDRKYSDTLGIMDTLKYNSSMGTLDKT